MPTETVDQLPPKLAAINTADPREAVDIIVGRAIEQRASDLFIQPNSNHYVVSLRRLGVIKQMVVLAIEQGLQVVNVIKSSAGMDLSERRHPMDGRWSHQIDGVRVDCRVNSIGTLHGEDLNLRLLPTGDNRLPLSDLGFVGNQFNDLRSMLHSASGLLLVTGPIGAGKSTTLYACLNYLNNGKRMINTLEDPIEQVVKGARQCQVAPKVGLGFLELLRGILRQSPDVIMIGEIRDEETANTAVRAANSGHLVLSTLHAPLAAGAVQSMLAYGVNPFFLGNSLLGIVAQRLIRVLSPDSRQMFDVSHAPQTFKHVQEHLEVGQGHVIYGPDESDPNSENGYIAQTGLFEVLKIDRQIKEVIASGANAQAIHRAAMNNGMLDFGRAALIKTAQGITSVEEMSRVIPATEFDDYSND